ncbi:MAG: response regulator [Magnetococcales bacterium]|nr:response regulator [Magnetococcales bacterium]NGZ26477.1 response regulator [Magnetococcales bacterium]
MSTILLIDDEEGIRNYIKVLLEHAGHGVVLAENGAKGLEICQYYNPDLIITDLIMTSTDGLTVLRKMRERDPYIPIIAMTGGDPVFDSSHLLAVALIEQADVLLKKPFSCEELLESVRKLTSEEL